MDDAISYPEEDQILLKLAEWITLEKICCPFIKFSLEVGDVENEILLKLRGSESVKIVLFNALGMY